MFFKKKISDSAFEEAALEHLDALYGTAMRLTGQVSEAEDLVQDTYLRAIRFRRRFEPGTNLRAWMFKIMINLFINKYRRNQRVREITEGPEQNEMIERMYAREHLDAQKVPEEYFFERMFSDDVVAALGELPHDYKMVVLLTDVNDFSYAQVADILGIPVGTVMSRLHRGRKLLQKTLYSFALKEGYVKARTEGASPVDLASYRQMRRNGH